MIESNLGEGRKELSNKRGVFIVSRLKVNLSWSLFHEIFYSVGVITVGQVSRHG